MLFIPPTDAELNSYNEIKYKKQIAVTYSLTTMNLEPRFISLFSDSDLVSHKESKLISSDLKIIDNDFNISNLSTWEDYDSDFEINELNIKLLKNKSFTVKSKITKINQFIPQIVLD